MEKAEILPVVAHQHPAALSRKEELVGILGALHPHVACGDDRMRWQSSQCAGHLE
jgi:hypothetical protein